MGVIVKACKRGCHAGDQMCLTLIHRVPGATTTASRWPSDGVWRIEAPQLPPRVFRCKDVPRLLSQLVLLDGHFCPFTSGDISPVLNERLPDSSLTAAPTQAGKNSARRQRLERLASALAKFAGPAARQGWEVDAQARGDWVPDEATHERYARVPELDADAVHRLPMCIKQPGKHNGICWYGSMWAALLLPPQTRDLVVSAARKNEAHRPLASMIGDVLHDPECAERMRRYLFYRLNLGDDPEGDPLEDGQNGWRMCEKLLAALGVRVAVAVCATGPRGQTKHQMLTHAAGADLVCLRCPHASKAPPLHVSYDGRLFRLKSGLVGNETCVHQTAVAEHKPVVPEQETHRTHWACYDPDVAGFAGPYHWSLPEEHSEETHVQWYDALQRMTHVTKPVGSQKMCFNNPANQSIREMARRMSGLSAENDSDKTHMDWVYATDGAAQNDAAPLRLAPPAP